MLYYERRLKRQGYNLIIGVDEVGRGPLAGPVVAAAVHLKTYRFKNCITDSKKLNPAQREKAFLEIIDKSLFGLGIVTEDTIDAINILEATRLSMQNAVDLLVEKLLFLNSFKKVFILADGNMSLNFAFPYLSIIDGESKSKSIASASILAKVIRDRIMGAYDRAYPQYGFLKHKGYSTKEHRQILKKIGPSRIHRKSFCYG